MTFSTSSEEGGRNGGGLPARREVGAARPWSGIFAELSAADRAAPLEPALLERLAMAAYLVGRDSDCADAWSRAHNEYLHHSDVARAARCAFWLGFGLLFRGGYAQANGWFTRARRLLEDHSLECAERGFLLLPAGVQQLGRGDLVAAHDAFSESARIGARFSEPDLVTLGRMGQGQVLVRQGRITEGVALLDEVMVAVTSVEVSPFTTGLAYCAVIDTCLEIFDLRRAHEWTAALSEWCDSQPDLVPFRGQCLVRRAELMRLHGAWHEAMREAERACASLSDPPEQGAIGLAFYQLAEVHRLRGDFANAEKAYAQASRWDRRPRPGMAQLRLAQRQPAAAQATIRRLLDEANDERSRPELLAVSVEINLAVGDVPAARAAAEELQRTAAALNAPYLNGLTKHATGHLRLAEGDASAALGMLRDAWLIWQQLEAPYQAARTRILIGLTCRALGDDDSAAMELDGARAVLQELGAAPDLAAVEQLRAPGPGTVQRLTARETQVIRLLATGKTNRAIAAELSISEKTVARHVSNLFLKLGVQTRAAAAAYAFRHQLV
jgi:DNA-binding CsgD family transcriptional regulator